MYNGHDDSALKGQRNINVYILLEQTILKENIKGIYILGPYHPVLLNVKYVKS